MNKFLATVRFRDGRDVAFLMSAFFENFNPESSILVKGNEATLEILFEEPPMAIINAMRYCEDIELKYGEVPKGVANIIVQDTKEKVSTQERIKEGDNSEIKEKEDTIGRVKKRGKIIEKTDIPKLEEIASKSTSFENFAELVAEWLEMESCSDMFKNLIIAVTEVENISWKGLIGAVKNKRIDVRGSGKLFMSNKVSKKNLFSKSTREKITILPFLTLAGQFKDYPFVNTKEQCITEEPTDQREGEVIKKSKDSTEEIPGDVCKARVKMECMPEIKEFEEILAYVDKTQAVEKRVYNVLIAMGIKKLFEKERKQILKIVSTAVRRSPIDLRAAIEENGIPETDRYEVQMKISEFINTFGGMYDTKKKIILSDFLSDLQKIIMLEDEIEKAPDL